MSTYEYHQLLKFLYFEGYADSYKEAEYMIEEMDDDEFDALCEEVFSQEIDEEEKWIQKAIKKPGALHKQLGVPAGEKIPAKELSAAAGKGGKLGKRARLAQTLSKLNKEELELYDFTLSYLLDEGYAETEEAAEVIFENMSDEWLEDILEDAESYARRQANKQARGRAGKTPLYTTKTSGKLEKTPEGKWQVKKTETTKMSSAAQMGKFRSGATGSGPGVQGGGHGGRGMGYVPAKHSTGGIHRGVKKSEQKKAPEPKLNPYQRRMAVARSKQLRTGGSATGYAGLAGGRAAERARESAKKSFGSWSKSQG